MHPRHIHIVNAYNLCRRQGDRIPPYKLPCVGVAVSRGGLYNCEIIPGANWSKNFQVDYGFFGVMFPVLEYIPTDKIEKTSAAAVATALLGLACGGIQWYALAALPLLVLYNGQRGRLNMKYLFYIYYPAHLAIIWLIDYLL